MVRKGAKREESAGKSKRADRGKEKAGAKRSRLRRILRRVLVVALVLVFLPYVIVPLYAVVNPPITLVMLQRSLTEGVGIHKEWVDIDAVSPRLVRAVLAAEDARFCSHHGVDWVEMRNALQDDDGPMRGASTITMQTARTLFFPGGRSWIRKVFEVPLAVYTDLVLSKRRILELYLNVAEWGPNGVYGVAAASKRAFGVTPADLSAGQSALLAAALPSPATRNPAKPTRGYSRVARRIAGRAAALGAGAECVLG